jgi:K+-sensing histidine kinase KdpD
MGERVVAACERQERLLEALLAVSRSGCGRLRQEFVDLAATAAEVLCAHDHHGLRCTTALAPARTIGDPQLIERLVANLVANAVRHNIPGGRLDVATYTAAGRAIFTIANTGPLIPAGELPLLFQPFQRLHSHAGSATDGLGLGLAIVQAIATSHDATLTAAPQTGGGLGIDIGFRPKTRRRPLVHRPDANSTSEGDQVQVGHARMTRAPTSSGNRSGTDRQMTPGMAIQATADLRALSISLWAGLGVLAEWAAAPA